MGTPASGVSSDIVCAFFSASWSTYTYMLYALSAFARAANTSRYNSSCDISFALSFCTASIRVSVLRFPILIFLIYELIDDKITTVCLCGIGKRLLLGKHSFGVHNVFPEDIGKTYCVPRFNT